MSERPTLSLKQDYPPKALEPVEGFDAADARKKANETLDDLKKSLYAQGISPAAVSKQWSAARDLHDRIYATIGTISAAKSEGERSAAIKAYNEQLAQLKGDVSDDLSEAIQESLLARPKEKGDDIVSNENALEQLPDAMQAHMKSETAPYLATLDAREQEIRARLIEINAVGSRRDVNKEGERLEDELRGIENARKVAMGQDKEPAAPEQAVPGAAAKEMDSGYEGAPHFPVPAVIPQEERVRGKVPLPEGEVIHLPDLTVGSEGMDVTPKEGRDALRAAVEKHGDAPKASVAEAERADVQAKETAYLTAFKRLEKKRTFLNRMFKKDELKEQSGKVDVLKRAYDESRIAYGKALTNSAAERLEAKGRNPDRAEKVLNRYNRLVRFNEVVKPAMEKKIAARQEALDSRGRNAFEKALGWSAKANQKLEAKYGKTGAKAIRAAASALLITGGVAAAGTLGVVGAMSLAGLAGYGTFKFARSFGGILLGGALGEGAAHGYEALWGRKAQRSAEASLKTEGRSDDLTMDSLRAIDRTREKLGIRADEMTLVKKKQLVRALVAFGVGAGSAAALAEFSSIQHAAEAAAGAEAPGVDVPESPVSAPEAAAVAPSAPAPVEAWAATIDRPGEGASQLFVDLRQHYGAMYPDPSTAPPAIRHILEAKDADALSREFGFIDGKNDSLLVKEGASLSVDSEGRLVFHAAGSDAASDQVLYKPDGAASDHVEGRMLATVHEQPSAEAPVAPDASVEDPSAALNNAQLTPEASAAPEAATVTDAQPASTAPVAPTPESVPAPEASRPEAPVSEASSPEAPVANPDVYLNPNKVEIDMRTPHVYETQAPDGTKTLSVVGGKGNESFYAAQQYAAAHPEYFAENPVAIVRFSATDIDSLTGAKTPYNGGFRLVGGELSPVVDSELPPPDPTRFTKRLLFVNKGE